MFGSAQTVQLIITVTNNVSSASANLTFSVQVRIVSL
jgi:hypothetical protein